MKLYYQSCLFSRVVLGKIARRIINRTFLYLDKSQPVNSNNSQCFTFFQIDSYGLKSKDFLITYQSKLSSEIDLDTYSLLTIPIQTNLLNSGNLKVKCVVSMWNLFHKSNEISVEIQGLDPHPKSIRHVDAKNISAAEKNFVEVLHNYESGQSSVAVAKLIILNFSLIQFYITFL